MRIRPKNILQNHFQLNESVWCTIRLDGRESGEDRLYSIWKTWEPNESPKRRFRISSFLQFGVFEIIMFVGGGGCSSVPPAYGAVCMCIILYESHALFVGKLTFLLSNYHTMLVFFSWIQNPLPWSLFSISSLQQIL